MNFRSIGDAEVAEFAKNVAKALAGGELTALDPVLRTELLAVLGSLPEELADRAEIVMAAEGKRKSEVSGRNQTADALRSGLARVQNSLKASLAPGDQFALCGFKPPARPVRIYMAGDPTGVRVEGFATGFNRVRFNGNNSYGRVTYEIWRRDAPYAEWQMHAITRCQTYIDSNVPVGKYFEYKIRAVAARSISNFSDKGVVWAEVVRE